MAFEMHPASNVERRSLPFSRPLQSSGYATLKTPFEQPAYEQPFHDYSESPAPYFSREIPTEPASSRSISDFGVETSYDAYGSRAHINEGGYGGGYTHTQSTAGRAWQPGFFEQLPYLGSMAPSHLLSVEPESLVRRVCHGRWMKAGSLLAGAVQYAVSALVGTVLFTFAAVAILLISDGKNIDSWSVTPSTYISIFTALANITLTYALYQGIVISFWRKAGQGATLLELHQYWSSGSSFWGAIRGIFLWRGKAVALACIFTILSILRGPLMQRASSVKNTTVHTTGTTTVHAAQPLPSGWAGTDSGRTSSPSYLNPNFTAVMASYSSRDPMTITHSYCGPSCLTSIKGFGFGVSCNKTGVFYSLAPIVYPNGSVTIIPAIDVFAVSASTIPVYGHGNASELDQYGNLPSTSEYPYAEPNMALLLNTTLMFNSTEAENGTMQQHLCALRGGIVSYPVHITNGTVTLQSSSWRNDTFLEDRGLYGLVYNGESNLGGFVLAANNLYSSSANMQFGGGVGFILNFVGFLPNQYLNPTSPGQNYYYLDANISWRDPMEDMLDGMREIAFRSALDVARYNLTFPESVQEVAYIGSQPQTVFSTNRQYMATAVVVSLLGVLAVIPTFRGWWELGRRVTLSPLEVAKAFDAPLLVGAESNANGEQLLKEVGQNRVRYGDVNVGLLPNGSGRKLQILHADLVKPPTKGLRYQ